LSGCAFCTNSHRVERPHVNDRSSVSVDGICFRSSPNRITHRSHNHAQGTGHNEYAICAISAPAYVSSTSGRPTSRLVLASRRSSAPRIARGQMNFDDVSCIINHHLPGPENLGPLLSISQKQRIVVAIGSASISSFPIRRGIIRLLFAGRSQADTFITRRGGSHTKLVVEIGL
jgi:hypothetical protein